MYKKRNRLISALSLFSVLFISLFLFSGVQASDYLPQWEVERITQAGRRVGLSNEEILLVYAIRKHENGGKGREFGILYPVRPLTYAGQLKWCVGSVKANRIRFYNRYNKRVTKNNINAFISFMGNRYAPIGAANDPKRLNGYWVPSVLYYWHFYYEVYINELRSGRL